MSRIGKAPITIPAGVTVDAKEGMITVKGPKGTLTQKISGSFSFENENGVLNIKSQEDTKQNRALHGLYRSIINNMVVGVSVGFEQVLELVGVGYRAEMKEKNLDLSLGFSHGILFVLPDEVQATAETVKGQPPRITLKCIDKQLLGQVVAKIRGIRPPEPYKGKGVRKQGEVVRRKAGKTSGKGKK